MSVLAGPIADGTAPDGPTAVVLAKRLLLRQITDAAFAPG